MLPFIIRNVSNNTVCKLKRKKQDMKSKMYDILYKIKGSILMITIKINFFPKRCVLITTSNHMT